VIVKFSESSYGQSRFALPTLFKITKQAQLNGDEGTVINPENGRCNFTVSSLVQSN